MRPAEAAHSSPRLVTMTRGRRRREHSTIEKHLPCPNLGIWGFGDFWMCGAGALARVPLLSLSFRDGFIAARNLLFPVPRCYEPPRSCKAYRIRNQEYRPRMSHRWPAPVARSDAGRRRVGLGDA